MIGDKLKKIFKNKEGYSLLEMVVAVAMFATIFLMVTSIYLSLIKSQRSVIATQTTQESMKFVLEMISKEIRTAEKSDDACSGVLGLPPDEVAPNDNKIFNTSNSTNTLYFRNKDGQCVAYSLQGGRLMINRDNLPLLVTPNELELSNLSFIVIDDDIGAFHSTQPTVTIRVDTSYEGAGVIHNQKTTLQTSITSRYYE